MAQADSQEGYRQPEQHICQLDLADIYRTLHPPTKEDTFFSSSRGIFTKVDHMLGHKTYLNKVKKIEIIQSMGSNQARMELN